MGQQLPNPGRGESLISICENTVCFLYVGREKLLKQATGNVEEIEFVLFFIYFFFLICWQSRNNVAQERFHFLHSLLW